MGLADRDYMRARHPAGQPSGRPAVLAMLAIAVIGLVAAFVWLDRPDLVRSLGLSVPAPALSFPASGTAGFADGPPSGRTADFTIRDASGDGLEKVIRFRTPDTLGFVAELYLRPGESGLIRLPPGLYRLHLMQGPVWRGPDVHFGAAASTFDMGSIAIGGDVDGIDILPQSPTGRVVPIPGTRF